MRSFKQLGWVVPYALTACAPHVALTGGAAAPPGPVADTSSVAGGSAQPQPNESSATEALEQRERRQSARTWGWVAIAVGSSGAVVALGTSIEMLHEKSIRDSQCDATKTCSTAGLAANAQLSALSGWNIASFIVGAAGIGTGAVLLLSNPSDRKAGMQIGIAPVQSGAAVAWRSTF